MVLWLIIGGVEFLIDWIRGVDNSKKQGCPLTRSSSSKESSSSSYKYDCSSGVCKIVKSPNNAKRQAIESDDESN